jgi:hypothetical protein
VTDLTAVPKIPLSQRLFQNLASPATFSWVSLSLATLVFSFAKLTAYAADRSEFLFYTLSALALSQSFAMALLGVLGKAIFRSPWVKLRTALVVASILLASAVGTILFEAILHSWGFEPIPQSIFQRIISLLFAVFIYLGFGWVTFVFVDNFNQVKLGKELLNGLSKQQFELTATIRDSRTFAVREVSLEIQSTRGSLENLEEAIDPNQEFDNQIFQLQETLDEVERRVTKISNRILGSAKMQKIYSKTNYSTSAIIKASTQPNYALPGLISAFAFFGFSSWLSYFLDDADAFFWGVTLGLATYGIFWAYEKFIVKIFLTRPVLIRIFIYELIVATYLFFLLIILGYFGGDDSSAYGAALAYAAIPFIFFNGGAVLGGIIFSSMEHRERLTSQALLLRRSLSDLEQIRSDEDKVWKALFAGDIALSPTTASVILRDATLSNDNDRVLATIPKVNTLWLSVLAKLPNQA